MPWIMTAKPIQKVNSWLSLIFPARIYPTRHKGLRMTTNCKNCGSALHGKYCVDCGQAANTHQINAHFLWHDIQHGLMHFDKGILYSIKELFTRPGATIREYLEGKRVWHFKPVSMLILLATVYGLLYHFFHIGFDKSSFGQGFNAGFNHTGQKSPLKLNLEAINDWIGTHYALVTLIQLPFYAIASRLAFRKSGYNYVEHLIMNAFLASQRMAVHILLLPLSIAFNQSDALLYVSTAESLIDFGLILWGYTSFFNRYSTGKALALSILSYLLVVISAVLVVGVLGIIIGMVYVFMHAH
jgi:hypothetical protein